MKNILVTGGAGFIGSHVSLLLLEQGYDVYIIDNLSNSSYQRINQISELSGRHFSFFEKDICNLLELDKIFADNKIDVVMHFAGLKSIQDSINDPQLYFKNNILGTRNLLNSMEKNGVKKIIFSSSATVYGSNNDSPIRESDITSEPKNPYGKSKFIIEMNLKDLFNSKFDWGIICLRYFNPVGAHQSGKLGENIKSNFGNIMPILCNVASGKQDKFQVFGNDYETHDGTCIRDYIHVVDLAMGHIMALKKIINNNMFEVINLGTGKGHSVLELIDAFEKSTGQKINYEICDRREGDIDISFADVSYAYEFLNWKAKYNIKKMCIDSWAASERQEH